MANTCSGSHYTCGAEANWLTGQSSTHSLTQNRNNKLAFMLGGTEIIVSQVIRTFSITSDMAWVLQDGFVMYDEDDDLFQCGTVADTSSGTISENCTYITTQTHFLDTRYNNGIFTEVTDTLEFTDTGEICEFKETWGNTSYHKFSIINPTIQRTTRYFVVLAGVKTILKEKTESVAAYASPLIIVYPNPPSLAIPWVNVDDINDYGFYDYRADGGIERIEADGGDDYYWPEWIQEMGVANHAQDAAAAAERYLTFYLNTPAAGTSGYNNPGILTDSTPVGSICQDKDANVFYSMTLGGIAYNSLTDGNLSELFPLVSTGQYYPVGLA